MQVFTNVWSGMNAISIELYHLLQSLSCTSNVMNVISGIPRTATQAGSPSTTIKVNTIHKIHDQVQDGVELAGANECD